jgi:hypothetical protein
MGALSPQYFLSLIITSYYYLLAVNNYLFIAHNSQLLVYIFPIFFLKEVSNDEEDKQKY